MANYSSVGAPNSTKQNKLEQMETQLGETLLNFGQLISKYQFGEPLVEASGGFHIDKGL